jgi:hypothetical protein
MHTNSDLYGHYAECLQCGHMKDLPEPNKLLESLKVDIAGKKVA